MVGGILILVARMLTNSLGLFIAISNGYSFSGMHYVTSKKVVGADGKKNH